MPSFFERPRPSFTLVELLASIAIIGIVSTMVFAGFSNEQKKSSLRRAAESLQLAFQTAQNKAQSGVFWPKSNLCQGGMNEGMLCANNDFCDHTPGYANTCTSVTGTPCGRCTERPPAGYGISIDLSSAANKRIYTLFGDLDNDGPLVPTHPNGLMLGLEGEVTINFPSQIELAELRFSTDPSCTSGADCRADIAYAVPSGKSTIKKQPNNPNNSLIIVLKHTTINLCYSITVQANSNTVSRRQLASCP